jgi:hypothetical protein
LNHFDVHAAILPEIVELQKPTVGFQARFLGEGPEPCKLLAFKALQGATTRKTEKTREKMSFFPRAPRVFLPNRPVLGPFLAVKLLRIPQVVLCERVARLEKQRFFKKTAKECWEQWGNEHNVAMQGTDPNGA